MFEIGHSHEPHRTNNQGGELTFGTWICAGTEPPVELRFDNTDTVDAIVHPRGEQIHDRRLRLGTRFQLDLTGLDYHEEGISPKVIDDYARMAVEASFDALSHHLPRLGQEKM